MNRTPPLFVFMLAVFFVVLAALIGVFDKKD